MKVNWDDDIPTEWTNKIHVPVTTNQIIDIGFQHCQSQYPPVMSEIAISPAVIWNFLICLPWYSGFYGLYPLAMTNTAIENHSQWESSHYFNGHFKQLVIWRVRPNRGKSFHLKHFLYDSRDSHNMVTRKAHKLRVELWIHRMRMGFYWDFVNDSWLLMVIHD